MQSGFRALLVSCVPQDIETLSAYFLIPVGLVSRVNNLTTVIGEVISTATKALEKKFRSKREEPTEFM